MFSGTVPRGRLDLGGASISRDPWRCGFECYSDGYNVTAHPTVFQVRP